MVGGKSRVMAEVYRHKNEKFKNGNEPVRELKLLFLDNYKYIKEYTKKSKGQEELYDMENDPQELYNLIDKVPEKAKSLKFLAKSNRSHTIKVFIDDTGLGEASLDEKWNKYCFDLPDKKIGSKSRLRFISDTISPADSGVSSDRRSLGFVLSWYAFSGRKCPKR